MSLTSKEYANDASPIVPEKQPSETRQQGRHNLKPPKVESSRMTASCPDEAIHKQMKNVVDTVIPCNLETVWDLIYGNEENWMKQHWSHTSKHTNISIGPWMMSDTRQWRHSKTSTFATQHLDQVTTGFSRAVQYTAHLNSSFVKSTKCILHETIVNYEPER